MHDERQDELEHHEIADEPTQRKVSTENHKRKKDLWDDKHPDSDMEWPKGGK